MCHPLTFADVDAAARLYTEVFLADEPTTRISGMDFPGFFPFAEAYVKILARKKLSFIAREIETGEIVGFIFSLDLTDDPEQEEPIMKEFLSHFRGTVAMLDELEARYFNHETLLPGSVFHVFQIGVRRGFRERGTAKTMIHQTVSHARDLGFSQVAADCTGPVSKQAFDRCGFHEVCYYPYDEFCMDEATVFAGLNQGISLMVRDLESGKPGSLFSQGNNRG